MNPTTYTARYFSTIEGKRYQHTDTYVLPRVGDRVRMTVGKRSLAHVVELSSAANGEPLIYVDVDGHTHVTATVGQMALVCDRQRTEVPPAQWDHIRSASTFRSATREEKQEYAATDPVYPLHGWVKISDHTCAVEYLGEGKDQPNYEIMAPEGYKFTEGVHSLLCTDHKDLRSRAGANSLELCDDDCDCKHEASNQPSERELKSTLVKAEQELAADSAQESALEQAAAEAGATLKGERDRVDPVLGRSIGTGSDQWTIVERTDWGYMARHVSGEEQAVSFDEIKAYNKTNGGDPYDAIVACIGYYELAQSERKAEEHDCCDHRSADPEKGCPDCGKMVDREGRAIHPRNEWTRDDIERLGLGDELEMTLDTVHGKAHPLTTYGRAKRVVEIFARGVSEKGKAYVCFYLEQGPSSRVSGSISEGEQMYRRAH